jgi:MHS family proline/betaine transporter-like MFS transporter
MAAGTVLIGILPTYSSIGVLAPVLIVLARLVQGFSAGGEWGGAAAFLVEFAPPGRRGFYGSWQQFSIGLGSMAGSLAAFLVSATLDQPSLDSFGWRIPFLFGFILAPVGYYLRTRVGETPVFKREAATQHLAASPVRAAFATQMGAMLTACGSTIIWTVGGYLFLTFMPVFAVQQLKISPGYALAANTIAILLRTALTPIAGHISDSIGRKPMLMFTALGFLLLSYPLFYALVSAPGFGILLIVQSVAAFLMAVFSGPGPAMLCELFPTRLRSTALSIGYNLSTAIFGGFAPFIATYLVHLTGNPIAPVYYVMGTAAVSVAAILTIRDRTHDALDSA